MKHLKYILLLTSCSVTAYCYGQETVVTDTNRRSANYAHSQTPLGITTDHVQGKGKWMAAFTYTDVMMKDSRIGKAKVGNDLINEYYMMAPEKMNVQIYTAMLAYGITDRLTIMGTGGYALNSMYMTAAPVSPGLESSSLTSRSSGFADAKIEALYSLINKNNNRVITAIGIKLPTGTLTATGPTIFGVNRRLAYPMQTGAGTYALLPSVTYINTTRLCSYGAEAGANVNLGMNASGYRVGNTYNATAWGSYQVFPFISVSLRAEYVATGKIKGSDYYIDEYQYNDPASDSHDHGGKRVNMYAGLDLSVKKLKGFHLLWEYGLPVYENLEGVQMSLHANLLAGAQYTF